MYYCGMNRVFVICRCGVVTVCGGDTAGMSRVDGEEGGGGRGGEGGGGRERGREGGREREGGRGRMM